MKLVALWRISTEATTYPADDVTGKGAEESGGRWNHPGTAMLYVSGSIALACLETVVNMRSNGLPLNRYLVRITVPEALFQTRELFKPAKVVGWDAQPAGKTSLDFGTHWAEANRTALLEVPSVIIPEEPNYLINPNHPDARKIKADKVRRFLYDPRLR